MLVFLLFGLFLFNQISCHQQTIKPDFLFKNQVDNNLSIKREFPKRRWEKRSLGIVLTAKSALVVDEKSGKILYQKNSKEELPLASLTKLMTALVILDNNPDWDKVVQIKKQDQVGGASLPLYPGDKAKLKDLFSASLVSSTNNSLMAVVRSLNISQEEFVHQMNQKAIDLGLNHTHFVEPTGLDPKNVSTAEDIAFLFKEAISHPELERILLLKEYRFELVNNSREIIAKNTDKLLDSFLNKGEYRIKGGKTGYLIEAGYCLVVEASKNNHSVISVILGSQSLEKRFQETKGLVVWAFDNYQWK